MKDDAIASAEHKTSIEEGIIERNRSPQERDSAPEPNPHEYLTHIERLEVRFIIENMNKPFMPVELSEQGKKDVPWEKHECEYVKSGDIKATVAFEKGTAPADGNTEKLTDIFIEHMWNFVREVKSYG